MTLDKGPNSEDVLDSLVTQLYRDHSPALWRLAYVLAGSSGAADELVQEAFVAAWRHRERLSTYESPLLWLRHVLVNRARSRWRRLAREGRALVRVAERREAAPFIVDLPSDVDDLLQAVRQLPRRQAQVFALVAFDGLTVTEAARALRCHPDTARTHMRRARAALARQLDVEEGAEDVP